MIEVIVNFENVLRDIEVARRIIDNKIYNDDFSFSINSPIYKTTNENITHEPYINALTNRKKVLSIIGSGDQIINAILFGGEDIVGIDISRFPRYFLSLKLAAIKALDKHQYLDYFYNISKDSFSIKYYEMLRGELDGFSRIFWDCLYYNYNSSDLYYSPLFHCFNMGINYAISVNPFLQNNNYELLKKKLNDTSIDLYQHDIYKVNELYNGNFDLIILSNIINSFTEVKYNNLDIHIYNKSYIELLCKYKKFLKSLPLKKDGLALTYNITFNGEIINYFPEKEYKVYQVQEKINTCNYENEILIYQKKGLFSRRK